MPKSATFDDFPGLKPGDENYRARMLLELCSTEMRKAVGVRVIDGGDVAVLDVHPEMRALAILNADCSLASLFRITYSGFSWPEGPDDHSIANF